MAFKHKISTMFKNWGSKRTENSDIKDLEADIVAEQERINIKVADIGEYYWNLYSKNAFVPDTEAKDLFLSIRNSMEKIESLKAEIEETKKNASEERVQNNEELKEIEKREAAEAAERKRQKEAQAEAERRQKEAQAELEKLSKQSAARAAQENEDKK